MPLRSDWSEDNCPIRRSLDVLGDPWVLVIVRDVLHGKGQFEALRDNLGVSEAVLSRRLQVMVEAGLLARQEYFDGRRARKGYAATAAAADLLPVLQQLALWGQRHTTAPDSHGHMRLIHRTCSQETTQAETCSACGQTLESRDMAWAKSWKNTTDNLVGPGVVSTTL